MLLKFNIPIFLQLPIFVTLSWLSRGDRLSLKRSPLWCTFLSF